MKPPIVTIKVSAVGDGEQIIFTGTGSGRSATLTFPRETLLKARRPVAKLLRGFKDDVGSQLRPDRSEVQRALRQLFMRTCMLADAFTPASPSALPELREIFVEALPGWAITPDEVPVVEVEGDSSGFPFELLPVFDQGRPGAMDDIETFARRFLGYSTTVRRTPYVTKGGLAAGQLLDNDPKLPVSFSWYAPMSGAREEYDFFNRLAGQVELNGPWPHHELSTDAVLAELADGLFDPRRRYGDDGFTQDVQIQHFACHCDTGFEDPADYEIELSAHEGASHRISLSELNLEFIQRLGSGDRTTRPVVFLNACGSAHRDPDYVDSWPEWFLRYHHRAVVGTETLMPDLVAARYARFFYGALLSGRTVGDALVTARQELLHEFGNPLGLLYVLYGDPDIRIRRRVPQEVLDGCTTG